MTRLGGGPGRPRNLRRRLLAGVVVHAMALGQAIVWIYDGRRFSGATLVVVVVLASLASLRSKTWQITAATDLVAPDDDRAPGRFVGGGF